MNSHLDLSIPIDRVTWRDGQELASRDLRDSQASAEHFRHLHVHYQHKTWGVVEGLAAASVGPSTVGLSTGYALDIEGSQILLPYPTRVAIPANITTATTLYLVISRSGQAACSCDSGAMPDLPTLCPGIGSIASLWRGVLSWKTVKGVLPGLDILLARVVVAGGKLASKVDASIQRRAASMALPRVWSDSTQPGQTGWIDGMEATVANISATVGTSDAGFIAAPAYFAWLGGTSDVIRGFVSSASATGFTFVLREIVPPHEAWDAATANGQGWTIQWFAVEVPPPALLFPFLTA
jgi:hypothetical protein